MLCSACQQCHAQPQYAAQYRNNGKPGGFASSVLLALQLPAADLPLEAVVESSPLEIAMMGPPARALPNERRQFFDSCLYASEH
jgi:hypothetical protein